MEDPEIAELLDYWFNTLTEQDYWVRNDAVDQTIRDRFATLYDRAAAGDLDHWQNSADGVLALVIALDQLPRNMFRDDPKTWATDGKALAIAEAAIAKGLDLKIDKPRCMFLYMPFEHSEDLATQERSVEIFKRLDLDEDTYGFVVRHWEIISRFGRFPHRNTVLGRISTPEELRFLEEPHSSF